MSYTSDDMEIGSALYEAYLEREHKKIMQLKIKEIYRKEITTKDGREAEMINIIPEEEEVMDVNGDSIKLDGRRVSGFKDKAGETDKWVAGMVIKVQIKTNKSIGKEGDEMEWVNFKLPEGTSSIVEAPATTDGEEDW